jgi:hypothetical protein
MNLVHVEHTRWDSLRLIDKACISREGVFRKTSVRIHESIANIIENLTGW